MTVRIALIDDHPIFREGLRALLLRQADLDVVAEAPDAREGYQVVDLNRPDVVVLDVSLPGTDGISATRELRRRSPTRKVLLLSVHEEPSYAFEAMAAGASGYAFKSQPSGAVVNAIRTVARGEKYLPPGLEAVTPPDAQQRQSPLGVLSPREREVFALLVRGLTNNAVAVELCLSVKTVETHRSRIHKKLGIHSVTELIRFAARHDLLVD